MKAKHTQGVFTACPSYQANSCFEAKVYHLRNEDGLNYLHAKTFGDIKEEAEANAKLIASAPALLEALQEMYEVWYMKDKTPKQQDCREKAFNAIKQATK